MEGKVGAFLDAVADLGLDEGDFEVGGVVVLDELRFLETIDESLATACEVVGIEEPAGAAFNAEMSALAVAFFFFR